MGSGKHNWSFKLSTIANSVSLIHGHTELLWGDNYYNIATKQWSNTPFEYSVTKNNLKYKHKSERSFCVFIVGAIRLLYLYTKHANYESIQKN